jgi:imidazolonepropionase-like amidohydrolase
MTVTVMRQIALIIVALLACSALASDEIPGRPQERPIVIVGADIYPVDREPVPGGTIVFDRGKIVAIGTNVSVPDGAERIDAKGKRVYPGLFDAATTLGLNEIASIRATIDQAETGSINPNSRAEVAINPDSELIPVARANGILLALVAPEGGLLSGSSAVVQLDGWTWEEMTLKGPAAFHLKWPAMAPVRSWRVQRDETEQLKERDASLRSLRETFASARAYMNARQTHGNPTTQPDFDARYEAMIPLLEGKVPLVISADELRQIEAACAFAEREKLKLILQGGADAPLAAELIKRVHASVIVEGVQKLPLRRGAAYDEPFTLPARLREAGIPFCISGDRGASLVRNLPYHAATAAAFGLPQDEALKAITLYPAQIFGVADRVGSLGSGKDATLIVTDGDILETPTHVERAYVRGSAVDLNDKQKRLYEKYKRKYEPATAQPAGTPAGG